MKQNHLKAILYLVLAAVLWSTGGILIKLVNWNPVAIGWRSKFFSAVLMMLYMRKVKVKITSQKSVGATAYASTVILFVVANKMTTAANTILLQYTAPIWVALMAGWFLKEKQKSMIGLQSYCFWRNHRFLTNDEKWFTSRNGLHR